MTVATDRWIPVCALDALVADRGAAALVGGDHVAVFRLSGTGELFAIDNVDPFAGASVLSRGLVGAVDLDGRWEPYVSSPLRKQRFLLRDGTCLDDPSVRLATFRIRAEAGVVEVAAAT
jgi:nitrite reductase (NADH) small subunit